MSSSEGPSDQFIALQEALAGRYSLERELGRGGMGVVYLGRDVRLERRVAIKLLPPEHATQQVLRERFLREARTAAKLSHPHIVPIFAVDEVDDFVFFVMSFVEGETLGERIRRRGPLSPRDAARILREVSWGLAYAHAQGVVHRDVKPDNVLLEAGSGRALVTDFGIAHAGESSGLTSVGELLGTPEYMSPEQASGEEVDARTDLYALGVMGHYALSGSLPLQGPTVQATLAKQLTQPAPPLGGKAPELPDLLCQAVDRCLAKDPDDRFEGAEEFAEVLGRVLDARPQVPAAIRLFMDQNRESTAAIVAGIMLALMMLTIYVVAALLGELEEGMGWFFGVSTAMWLSIPFVMLGLQARRLLKAGHGRAELLRALKRDVEERRHELVSQVGSEKGLVDVWAPRVALAGIGILLVVVPVLSLLLPYAAEGILGVLAIASSLMMVGGGIVAAVRHGLKESVPGERWFTFWRSSVGKGLFGLAGLGVGHDRTASGGSYHPTEIAIGMAAERLFEDLPKEVRRSLGDLPGVVRTLEAHAERTRARVRELGGLLDEVGGRGPSGAGTGRSALGDKHGDVTAEVAAAREAAENRLSEIVGALEALRLELLRLHAGSGTVESMTVDLAAARELADDMERLGEGRREVEALLGDGVP